MGVRWLYLPIEVKVRECDAKLLLAYYAVKQGYQVVIGDHPGVEELCETYPEGIFFSKGGPHGFRKRVLVHAKEYHHKIVELDEEGLIFQRNLYIQDRMQKQSLNLVDQEYCWGSHQYKTILAAYPDLSGKLHITGNPRFDLLTPKYRKMYDREKHELIEQYGEFLLINTRFSQYNTAKGMKETVHYKHIQKLYHLFILMIKEIAEHFPDKTVIIRPHPGESFTSYRKAVKPYSNVHVIHEGNIIPWLYAAKSVIHNGCTSGIEASLMDRPVISYVPFETMEPKLPNQSGQIATTSKEVITLIQKVFDGEKLPKPQVSEMDDFKWSTTNYSYQSILSLCNQISLSPPLKKIIIKEEAVQLSRIKKRKRNFSLTKEEILSFFQKLNQLNETELRCQITRIGNHVYHLTC
ncbi:surface carbohydrate biosynthesis protein [Gracilibacillus xinjiangensis]|uniref:Surface carbohydrate biosynthesis protein n=1 Tax=Gracilibacillus xinjiangensis TaxID=1193282 RepID=A0ABV8WZ88_9BACI